MNQQEKMARAKALTYERLKTALEDFEQVDEYSFASLENIEGEDWWTVVSIVAKKNYDIDEALEEFEIKKETKRKRQEEKEKKEKSTGKDWKQNRPTKLKFTYKEQREYETIDDDIVALEEKIEKLDDDMVKNATNSGKLAEIMREKEAAEAQLEEKMDRWVYLNDLAEQIEAQKSGN